MKKRYWTKAEVRAIADLWETHNTHDIAQKLKRTPQQVTYMAGQMRKTGFNLPKKHSVGHLQSMLREVLQEKKKR